MILNGTAKNSIQPNFPSSITLLYRSILLTAILVVMGHSAKSAEIHLEISTEPGYFLQDDPNTSSEEFKFVSFDHLEVYI